jgi:branched-chain amino acid transport system ATP-binding protein
MTRDGSSASEAPLLRVDNLCFGYQGAIVVNGLSLNVAHREAIALLGANGAGKSTTVKLLAGVLQPQKGSIHFSGEDVTALPSSQMVNRGVTLVPEGRHVFPRLSVIENLQMGAYAARSKARYDENLARVFELFPRLAERQKQLAGSMSGGEQQMVAIARGLMSDPQLIILDEPSLGLMPMMVGHLFELIGKVLETGVSLILVEQNAYQALEVVQRAYVLEKGQVTIEGAGRELLSNETVRKSFLGL